jgi:hypothetical protein
MREERLSRLLAEPQASLDELASYKGAGVAQVVADVLIPG